MMVPAFRQANTFHQAFDLSNSSRLRDLGLNLGPPVWVPSCAKKPFWGCPAKYACAQWSRGDLDDIISRYKAIVPRSHECLGCLGIEKILALSRLSPMALRYYYKIRVRVLNSRVFSWSYWERVAGSCQACPGSSNREDVINSKFQVKIKAKRPIKLSYQSRWRPGVIRLPSVYPSITEQWLRTDDCIRSATP